MRGKEARVDDRDEFDIVYNALTDMHWQTQDAGVLRQLPTLTAEQISALANVVADALHRAGRR